MDDELFRKNFTDAVENKDIDEAVSEIREVAKQYSAFSMGWQLSASLFMGIIIRSGTPERNARAIWDLAMEMLPENEAHYYENIAPRVN